MSKKETIAGLSEKLRFGLETLNFAKSSLNFANAQYRYAKEEMNFNLSALMNRRSVLYHELRKDVAAFHKTLATHAQEKIIDAKLFHDPADVYHTIQPYCDKEGYRLFDCAKKMLNCNFYREFVEEDVAGRLENLSGYGMLDLIEASRFGSFEYEIVSSYELISSYSINKESAEYQEYRDKLYSSAIQAIAKSPNLFTSVSIPDLLHVIHTIDASEISEGQNQEYSRTIPADNEYDLMEEKSDIELLVDQRLPEPLYIPLPDLSDMQSVYPVSVSELAPPRNGFWGFIGEALNPQAKINQLNSHIQKVEEQIKLVENMQNEVEHLTSALKERSGWYLEAMEKEKLMEHTPFADWLHENYPEAENMELHSDSRQLGEKQEMLLQNSATEEYEMEMD